MKTDIRSYHQKCIQIQKNHNTTKRSHKMQSIMMNVQVRLPFFYYFILKGYWRSKEFFHKKEQDVEKACIHLTGQVSDWVREIKEWVRRLSVSDQSGAFYLLEWEWFANDNNKKSDYYCNTKIGRYLGII